MKRTLPPFGPSLPRRGSAFLHAALMLLVVAALAPHAVQAQVVFDDFNDGDVTDVGVFSETGGGIGVGTTDGADGTAESALSIGLNPAETGSFAGFVIPGGAGTTDVSGAAYLAFYLRPTTVQAGNLPLTLEINLHEDTNGNGTYEGATEDEFQAVYRVSEGDGYTFVQIPLASFGDDNAVFPGSDDGFDFSNLLEIVVAIGGPSGPEFAFAMDDIVFLTEPAPLEGAPVEFDSFDDGDVSDIGVFSETGAGIGVGSTDDAVVGLALAVGLNPAETGSFAGFVIPGGAGTTDASEAVYLRFFLGAGEIEGANRPLTLEINLHEDTNGNGTYEGATEDEFQAIYRIDESTPDAAEVLIPLASFGDDNAVFPGSDDGFDFSNLLEIVVAIGGPMGPEFRIGFDEVSFINSGTPVSTDPDAPDVPERFVLTNAYPNPFNPQTQFDLTVVQPQNVRVEVFDLLGRPMAVLHEGVLAPQTRHTFRIDARGWPSGLYLYRVTGEAFTETRSVLLLK